MQDVNMCVHYGVVIAVNIVAILHSSEMVTSKIFNQRGVRRDRGCFHVSPATRANCFFIYHLIIDVLP